MKRFIGFLLVLIAVSPKPTMANDLLQQGNNYYQKGDFAHALQAYQEVEKSGTISSNLYYNLGNSYYKTGNTAKAILYYEKTLKLAPNDADTEFNLKLANTKIIDKINPLPVLFYTKWWIGLTNLFSSHTWAVFSIICLFLCAVLLALFVYAQTPTIKRIYFYLSVLLFLKTILCFIAAHNQAERQLNNQEAIVMDSSVYVHSSPNEKSTNLFILHEGAKVDILENIGSWRKVRIANGNEGWLQGRSIETI